MGCYFIWSERDLNNSYPRQLVPRTTRTQDNSYPGQLVPKSCLGYELSWVRVVLGTRCLGYELSIIRLNTDIPSSCHWPAHRAGLLWLNFFGQSGSVSKFPPFLCVKLWVGWVGRGYIEISRYFPALWINRVTLVTKKKLWYSLGY